MTDTLARLTAALADRYTIERELAAILGAERFLKEIEVTTNLQHPNILPLYDSGEAEIFLCYVMPYVEGESLRDRSFRFCGRVCERPLQQA